ncbi:DUF2249 domain-containing protein [Paludibacterium purpuratum]|uniref:Uncharacterized protein (DUF2249 family) n=1 Tax=Paludibacterium purpuratum TaxID=1144873 RepID=A0A4R7AWY5_9NEIS|nr:DUF2249 domain-containing protein [Paludibacterium purpuratum]TDR70616.1 uncharacterized protein (DUF2249 family) [Paludibacterium purpuratum]
MTQAAVTLDVRLIEPRFRHALIFGIFQHLPVGEALLLTNDHDPKPLHYQFQAEAPETFSWTYLETGPERWQVRIGKEGEIESLQAQGRCCG